MLKGMTDIDIADIKPAQVVTLRRLFKRAVAEDFSYFPRTYQWKVLADNNLLRLGVAAVKSNRIVSGAWFNNDLIGYSLGGTNPSGCGKLYWLYVSPEGRSLGVGTALLQQVVERMKQRNMDRLSLVTHNYEDYYLKHGFQVDKTDRLYGVDMKVMSTSWAK